MIRKPWAKSRARLARVSSYDRALGLQLEQLRAAGCGNRNIYREKATAARTDRRELLRMLGRLDPWPDARAVGDGLGRAAHMATNPSATFKTPIARLAAGRCRQRSFSHPSPIGSNRPLPDTRQWGDIPCSLARTFQNGWSGCARVPCSRKPNRCRRILGSRCRVDLSSSPRAPSAGEGRKSPRRLRHCWFREGISSSCSSWKVAFTTHLRHFLT